MQLSDKQIYKEMVSGELLFVGPNPKYPFRKDQQVQPSSVDLRLGPKIMWFKEDVLAFDTKDILNANSLYEEKVFNDGEAITIAPHQIIFGEIYERICIPNYLSARIRGRNRISRLGVSVHCTGDYINPGFIGEMPLQIVNHNNFPVKIYPYIGICQMVLYELSDSPLVSYRDRLPLASNPYFNGMVPISKNNASSDSSNYESDIVAFRIHKMVEDYYRSLEEATRKTNGWKIEKTIQEATSQNLKYLIDENINIIMRDQYNSIQTGIQGPNSGKNATLYQTQGTYNASGFDFDIKQIIQELETIKKYLQNNFSDDEHIILNGDVCQATKLFKENNQRGAFEYLKKSGKVLLDISNKIGCTVLAKYFTDILGL